MKTTLITGGLGFIGSSICDSLLQKKYTNKCILLDNFGGYMNPIKDSFIDFRKQRFPSLKNIIIGYSTTTINILRGISCLIMLILSSGSTLII